MRSWRKQIWPKWSVTANDLAVYSLHLPLDAHPRLGNAQLLGALGFKNLKPFFLEKGRHIGWRTVARISRQNLAEKLAGVLGGGAVAVVWRRRAMRTDRRRHRGRRGRFENRRARRRGHIYHRRRSALAEELGLNVFYGGHYATETFGGKALAAELSKLFHIPWTFLDHPTGL
jgi:putative NIF3 family GTP cyclohydrolase 1 type 2